MSSKSTSSQSALSPGLSFRQFLHLLRFAGRRLNEERLPQVAGSLTFTTVLALVPVLTIALAIFTSFPLFNEFRVSLEQYFLKSLMPKPIADTILSNLNQFASKATKLSAFGAVLLLATAIAMLAMIERTFNQIWRVRNGRSLTQRILIYWSLITLGPLLIGASLSVTSQLATLADSAVRHTAFTGAVFYTTLSVLLATAGFTLLYVMVPNRVVHWRDAVWGGLVAAIGIEFTKGLFVEFVTKFPTYTTVYGALAALPIFLLWVYSFWLITLLGAALTAGLPTVKYERWWHVPTPGSDFIDAMSLLEVLHEARGAPEAAALHVKDIRSKTRIGFDEQENLLQKMMAAGWVARIKPDAIRPVRVNGRGSDGFDRWVLLANADQLRLADVYRLFVFNGSGDAPLARHVENAVEDGLSQTVAEYFGSASRKKSGRSASASTSASPQGMSRMDA